MPVKVVSALFVKEREVIEVLSLTSSAVRAVSHVPVNPLELRRFELRLRVVRRGVADTSEGRTVVNEVSTFELRLSD